MMNKEWSVSQLVNYLKQKLDSDSFIQSIWIVGELSNFTAHNSGHFYFTLKDDNSRINCVMFANYALRLVFKPIDGQKVLVKANTSIYEKSGQIQLYITEMLDFGAGVLYQRYLVLKEQLEKEGLFDQRHKKKILKYPFSIAVVTGANTAAYQDVVTTLKRRWPVAEIKPFFCLVQGNDAHLSVIEALSLADQSNVDVILLVRGGGSIEDLWSFNNESLVRFIHLLNTPIITGVGHETDTTLADLVADLRAPTPTGAAELATMNLYDIINEINDNRNRLHAQIKRYLSISYDTLSQIINKSVLKNPLLLVQNQRMSLFINQKTLQHQIALRSNLRTDLNNQLKTLLNSKTDIQKRYQFQMELSNQRIRSSIINNLINHKNKFKYSIEILNAYSPLNIIRRGYAIVNKDNRLIKSVDQIAISDNINIRLSDGLVNAKVIEKEQK